VAKKCRVFFPFWCFFSPTSGGFKSGHWSVHLVCKCQYLSVQSLARAASMEHSLACRVETLRLQNWRVKSGNSRLRTENWPARRHFGASISL